MSLVTVRVKHPLNRYSKDGVVYHRGKPVKVSQKVAEGLLKTGKFEAAKTEKLIKKSATKIIVKKEATKKEGFEIPQFRSKASLADYALKEHDIELDTSEKMDQMSTKLISILEHRKVQDEARDDDEKSVAVEV